MFKDIAPKPRAGLTGNARKLRRKMTLPEVILWHSLRQRPEGMKFRRQHPTGRYVLDFFCSDARLAIEVDGEAHSRGDRPQRDADRDRWLKSAGIQTIRIPAVEILKDADAVLRWIVAEAKARLPLHHPASPDGPPPRGKLWED
jgi:very-short-patch-repair endonuclease